MYPTTELLRTSFIKGIAKTTASVTVLGVVSLFYYLYNNVFDEKRDIYKKTKLDVKNLAKVFKKDNKKDNKKIIIMTRRTLATIMPVRAEQYALRIKGAILQG